jgi:ubiquinone/menaquinone biosynthesis C-methylase UbiE
LALIADKEKPVVLELGCGIGELSNIHFNYVGLDFSFPALKRLDNKVKRINGDTQCLPIRSNSIDFIFTWAAIEHVPNPELTFKEVERVLKPGGVAILAPAWNCRSWAAKGLPIRPYHEFSWPDRLSKATIPIRNHIVYRSLFAFPSRVIRELRFFLRRRPLPFDYRRLSPNLSDYIYTDYDAFTSLDSHAAIMYYYSRGFKLLSHPKFSSRFWARHDPVVLEKPSKI